MHRAASDLNKASHSQQWPQWLLSHLGISSVTPVPAGVPVQGLRHNSLSSRVKSFLKGTTAGVCFFCSVLCMPVLCWACLCDTLHCLGLTLRLRWQHTTVAALICILFSESICERNSECIPWYALSKCVST